MALWTVSGSFLIFVGFEALPLLALAGFSSTSESSSSSDSPTSDSSSTSGLLSPRSSCSKLSSPELASESWLTFVPRPATWRNIAPTGSLPSIAKGSVMMLSCFRFSFVILPVVV